MVANLEQNLVHLLDRMVHHWWELDDTDGTGDGEKKERTLLGRCSYSAYRFPVQFGQLQKALTPHLW